MKKNLEDYVKVYKGQLDPKLCDYVIAELNTCNWEDHRFRYNEQQVDHGTEPLEYHRPISFQTDIQSRFWDAIRKYVLEDINVPWYSGWQGFSNLKFIKYPEGSEMVNHCDHIHSIFDGKHQGIPILSVIGQLDEGFEGGELVMFDDTVYPLSKGDVIVFPSVFLYPHRITKITKGVRHSVVTWTN